LDTVNVKHCNFSALNMAIYKIKPIQAILSH